jgi:FkbM family methyltransferase
MTLAGLRRRFTEFQERLATLRNGFPHGSNPFIDIDRRLTRTAVDVIFDVGANVGQSTLEFRRWYPNATIHCFEPIASTFERLQANVRPMRRVNAHKLAFGDAARTVAMQVAALSDMSGVDSTFDTTRTENVEVQALDQFCHRHKIDRIDYLKIDTEGHDLKVLEGAESLLTTDSVAIVQVEAGMNPDNRFHVAGTDLAAYLQRFGYRLFGIYEQTLQWPTADAYLRRANLVFVSPETVLRNHWND